MPKRTFLRNTSFQTSNNYWLLQYKEVSCVFPTGEENLDFYFSVLAPPQVSPGSGNLIKNGGLLVEQVGTQCNANKQLEEEFGFYLRGCLRKNYW
ncbi:MAG: hypothetical protein HY537_09610 [Deltaproteobacteria bacterium]|nr:hypothetical protein [Deltaproteobacteria bacterium]